MASRHAYLVQAHGNFQGLEMLLRALDDSRNDIFLHIDARTKDVPHESLRAACKHSSLHFTPRIEVHWGGPSQIWSELLLLREAACAGEYQYYHLLSGADLPIKSQDFIHDFFDRNCGKEFVAFWKMGRSTRSRFLYSPLCEYGSSFLGNAVNNIFKGVQLLLGIKRNADVDFRLGPNWFSITDSLARYVLSRQDWIRRTFKGCCNADENFLQTLVWNSPFHERCFDPEERDSRSDTPGNMRYVDWIHSDHVRHPKLFTSSDIPVLKEREELFARKFDYSRDPQAVILAASLCAADTNAGGIH